MVLQDRLPLEQIPVALRLGQNTQTLQTCTSLFNQFLNNNDPCSNTLAQSVDCLAVHACSVTVNLGGWWMSALGLTRSWPFSCFRQQDARRLCWARCFASAWRAGRSRGVFDKPGSFVLIIVHAPMPVFPLLRFQRPNKALMRRLYACAHAGLVLAAYSMAHRVVRPPFLVLRRCAIV